MNSDEMKARTKAFALRIIRLVEALPRGRAADVIGRQLLRSATSVAANYRAACRAKSRADFISKLGTVEQEADESAFWLELVIEGKLMSPTRVSDLLRESNELTAIVVAFLRTARRSVPSRSNPKSAIPNPK